MTARAVASPVAVVLLLAVTVVVAGTLGVAAVETADRPTTPRHVVLTASASADGTVMLAHGGGPPLDVRRLTVRVTVDGTPLDRQPPVPFFSARGFHSGPTGPFNVAADPEWSVGETARFRVAGTNDPELTPGSRVVVRLYREGTPVATATTRV